MWRTKQSKCWWLTRAWNIDVLLIIQQTTDSRLYKDVILDICNMLVCWETATVVGHNS